MGAITWHDSGNHRRYGQRDSATGRIVYAFGVDLAPLAALQPELEATLHEKQLYDTAWMETKRQISWYRRQIRSLLLELAEEGRDSGLLAPFESAYEEIAIQLRTHIGLAEMRSLLDRHKRLHTRVSDLVGAGSPEMKHCPQASDLGEETRNGSSTSAPKDVHYKSTTQESSDKSDTRSPPDNGFQESVAEFTETFDPVLASGAQHVTLNQVLQAASERFRGCLPLDPRPMKWNDVVEAAYRLRQELHISQQSWAEACQVLGRVGASLCLLLTDRATERIDDPIRKPAAYFRGMVRRAGTGELRLHSSIFGLIERSLEEVS